MGNKNELLQKIDEGYSKFSKGQKKLADFIKKALKNKSSTR